MKSGNKFKYSIGIMSVVIVSVSFFGKVFGFFRELLLARYFGTTAIVDVYLMSYTIPAIFFGALPALGVGFTPVYFKATNKNEQDCFLTETIFFSGIISILCIIVSFVYCEQIVKICASGFTEKDKYLTESFFRITVWSVLFNTPVQVLIAYLNCNKNYISSSLSGLVISVTNAIFIVMASRYGEILLAWGYLIPFIIQFVWLFFVAIRIGYRPVLKSGEISYFKELLILAIPICISNILVDINGFVDKLLSSFLQEGSLSSLNYAFILRAVIITVFQTLLTTIYYPTLSELYLNGNLKKFNTLIKRIISFASLIIIPINIISFVIPQEIIQIILMRGNFNINSLDLTTGPFVMYMLSLTFIVIREVLIRVMYISNEAKGNLLYGAVNVLINVAFSLILVKYLNHVGLALATSVATIFTFPLYVRKVRELMPTLLLRSVLIDIIKIIFSAIIMGGIVMILRYFISIDFADSLMIKILKFLIYLIVGGGLYIAILRLTNVECMDYIIDLTKSKLKN